MIIDTHSHLNFKAYDADREEVIKRTQEEGLVCIDVGTKYETSKNAVELAEKNENIFAAIGMHPIHIKTDLMKLRMDEEEGAFQPLGEDFDKRRYLELAKSKRVVAIGEIGLDYYYKPKSKAKQEQFKQKQREFFIQQLEMAEELNLPVILHCRVAHNDALDILKKFQASSFKLRGVVHCFTGSWEEAQRYIDLGFYIGVNGIIDKLDLKEVIEKTPLDRIVVETDCPYLTPLAAVAGYPLGRKDGQDSEMRPASALASYGVARNEPIFVKYVVQRIADIRGIAFQEVVDATTGNAKKLFGI